MDQSEIETEQFLMAKSCGRLCAIAKPRVAAVLTADEFVRLAYLPRPLSGIGQYSGHAILIADMGQLLGLKRRSEHIVKFWIVVSERNRQVVLQIDDVFGFEPLVPLAVARKHRLLAGSFTSSDQKTGDIINVSAFLDSVLALVFSCRESVSQGSHCVVAWISSEPEWLRYRGRLACNRRR